MFSRNLLMVASALVLLSCAGENKPQNPSIEVQLKNSGECLSNFGSELNKYFKGNMSRAEVVAFWDCTSDAVKEFQRLTSGETGGGNTYTPQALRLFLYEHFFKSRKLSDEMLSGIMELKRVFVSGTSRAVTREELTRLQDFITEMKVITLELHPHVKVLFGRPVPASDTEVDAAARAFESASKRLGVWFDRFQQPYSFNQMLDLVKALQGWMKDDSDALDVLDKMERAIPVAQPAKRILAGGRSDVIEGHTWVPLMLSLGKVFHVYLDFRHAFKDDLNSGMIRGLMPDAIEQIGLLIEQAIARRLGAGLPFTEFQELFERLELSQLMPAEFTAKALRPAFDWLVIRVLGKGAPAGELTLSHVKDLRAQHWVWKNILGRVNGGNFVQIPEWHKFEAILNRTSPIGWDAEGRLTHDLQGPATWTQDNRRRMVWPFVVLNWIREGYVGTADQMTEDEMMFAVSEILPMLQNFGWMTTTKLSIGKRLVREADLFLFPSNGDFQLQLGEAVHYLAFVSSAFRIAEIWLAEADRDCGGRLAICVRELATKPGSRALEALPHLRQAVLGRPPQEFIKYMKAAEETTLGKVTTGDIGTKDILQIMMLFQYVEVFLKFYDTDRTEKIDLAESLEAYVKYGPTLNRLLSRNGLPPDEVLAFYTFMMKYGDNPFTMFGGSIYFVNWKLKRNDWVFGAERLVLMSILNQLSKL